jgi:hypothetical protein
MWAVDLENVLNTLFRDLLALIWRQPLFRTVPWVGYLGQVVFSISFLICPSVIRSQRHPTAAGLIRPPGGVLNDWQRHSPSC